MILTMATAVTFVAMDVPKLLELGKILEPAPCPRVFAREPQLPELVQIPGPSCKIPVIWLRPNEIACAQVYVSGNRGKTWVLASEIAPSQKSYVFRAKWPGEYWFVLRIKYKNGTFDPADMKGWAPEQRIHAATGSNDPPATAKQTATVTVNELDDELTRAELELIRKEIKRLTEAKEFTPKAEEKIDRLRARLQQARERLGDGQNIRPSKLQSGPPVLLPQELPGPNYRIPSADPASDQLIIPVPVPALPVAPTQRALERRS